MHFRYKIGDRCCVCHIQKPPTRYDTVAVPILATFIVALFVLRLPIVSFRAYKVLIVAKGLDRDARVADAVTFSHPIVSVPIVGIELNI